MRRIHFCLALCAVLSLVACSKRAPQPADAAAGKAAASSEASLPSGATLTVVEGWKVIKLDDGIAMEGPEKKLRIEFVEIEDQPDMAAATAEAWKRRRPDFKRDLLAATDKPGRDGWDAGLSTQYKTSPEENRLVAARALKKGKLVVAVLFDVPAGDLQRRQSQVLVSMNSLIPPGHVRESYAKKKPATLDAAKIKELTEFIERMREIADVPGLAVALFDREKVLLEAGFGVRKRGGKEPVTADTLFLIASNTKPLVTLLLAKLVDEGRFKWDTPVTEVYPAFRLGKPETTRSVLMKHLVCACTGLPRQDFEWFFTFQDSSPEQQFEVLAGMQPTTEFGALFQYSNPLASAAGYIAAHLVVPDKKLGPAFEQAMQEKIFAPLGMNKTTFSFDTVLAGDHASPHSFNLELVSTPVAFDVNRCILPVMPAGGAWSSVRDYARYVQMEIAKGLLPDGSRYIGEKSLLERRRVMVTVSKDKWYGMGLSLEDVKGIRVISHGGSMIGYKSNFFFFPDPGIGGVILTNADTGYGVAKAVTRRVLEVVYDGTPEAEEDLHAGVKSTKEYYRGEQKDWKVPPDPASVGRLRDRYRHPALGDITVVRSGKDLVFQFGGWKSKMGTKKNPDGSISFLTIDPGILGFEFAAPKTEDKYQRLTLRDPQHTYPFEAVK